MNSRIKLFHFDMLKGLVLVSLRVLCEEQVLHANTWSEHLSNKQNISQLGFVPGNSKS